MERSCEPMNKNRIEGAAEQGEQARDCEALVTVTCLTPVRTIGALKIKD